MNDPDREPRATGWERHVIERFAREAMAEWRRARRWGVFFKLVLLLCVTGSVAAAGWFAWSQGPARASQHTALVEINGVLQAGGEISADNVLAALKEAFEDKRTAGVVLRVNSPGGSPVQAGIIYDEIRRQRERHPKIPLYAVIDDIGASGGYYVAAAADRIYVDKASIVGSIGVLMDGFGFVETLDKLGVERRLLTAGRNKGFLDPFSTLDDEQRRHAQGLLNEIHTQFIDAVRRGRGERLKPDADVFTGLVWSGAHAIELGLVDAFGNLDSVARDVIKAEEVVDFSRHEGLLDRLAKRMGVSIGAALPGAGGWKLR